jgi:molecular chaperone GrpE
MTKKEDEIQENEASTEEDLDESKAVESETTAEGKDDVSTDDPKEISDESSEEKIERLEGESAEYLDGWQRARAEFSNYKKRVERERGEARSRITGEVITRYLGVVDDLSRALSEPVNGEDTQDWVAGIELIYQKFIALLEAEGVEPIEPENVSFDPNYHEAITFEEDDQIESGYVIDYTQRGYTMGERVLRPALVRVAK